MYNKCRHLRNAPGECLSHASLWKARCGCLWTDPYYSGTKEQYVEKRYTLLESVIPAKHLVMAREEEQPYMDAINAEMDTRGVDVLG